MPTAPSCPQGIMWLRLETVPALGAGGRWTRHSRGTSPRTGSGLLHLTWPRIDPTGMTLTCRTSSTPFRKL